MTGFEPAASSSQAGRATGNKNAALIEQHFRRRDDWIRTSDLFVPNEARYLAALHPEFLSDKNNISHIIFILLFSNQ
jgi:hypothetical protein